MNFESQPLLQQISKKLLKQGLNLDFKYLDILPLSDFLMAQQLNHPQWFVNDFSPSELKLEIGNANSISNLKKQIRIYRNATISKLIIKQLESPKNTNLVMRQCSKLAINCINAALDWLHAHFSEQFGIPKNQLGEEQKLVILAMGKLGGMELNLSSDIDLIFTYPESGNTEGGPRSIDNSVYFNKLAQTLVAVLTEMTQDGFVFRVDTRLRPFGESGSLVSNFDAISSYYLEQGRGWERFAMIKARTITGEEIHRNKLMGVLEPFTYRRYIDFSMLETPRKIKQQIEAELRRRKLGENLKLGPGGIREIEFIVQAMQLIHGGKLRSLQQNSTLQGLKQIAEHKLLDEKDILQLEKSYRLLRYWEHCLQSFADQQTQTLPKDKLNQQRLCYLAGTSEWSEWLAMLDQIREPVHNIFSAQFSEFDRQQRLQDVDELGDLWLVAEDNSDNLKLIEGLGFKEPRTVLQNVIEFKNRILKKTLPIPRKSEWLLSKIVPEIIRLGSELENQNSAVTRMISLIEAIMTRTAYLNLFFENKDTIKLLMELFSLSPWIAEHTKQFPLVLDDLLNPNWINGQDIDDTGNSLLRQIARIPNDDEEQLLDVFREFKQSSYFQLAACFSMNSINMKQLGIHLSNVAQALLEQAYLLATTKVQNKYGVLRHETGEKAQMIVVAMGKLGSHEMGFSSDLDLVFIHDGCESLTSSELTNGNSLSKQLDGLQYFAKIAQSLIHALSIRMNSGILYEIDTRLRPSGNSGFLVSSIEQFQHYQLEQAWTWEHQALTRARVICGGKKLTEKFKVIRSEVISIKREQQELRLEIIEMRLKMKLAIATTNSNKWDLKQGDGGLTDIEFLIQYLVLLHSSKHPSLLHDTDNLAQLRTLAKLKILSSVEASLLSSIYLGYLDYYNRQTLLQQHDTGITEFTQQRNSVIKILENHKLWPWK